MSCTGPTPDIAASKDTTMLEQITKKLNDAIEKHEALKRSIMRNDIMEEIMRDPGITLFGLTLGEVHKRLAFYEEYKDGIVPYVFKAREEELKSRVEQLEVQLAGCACAALGWGPVATKGQFGWSPAYQDVLDLRKKLECKCVEKTVWAGPIGVGQPRASFTETKDCPIHREWKGKAA